MATKKKSKTEEVKGNLIQAIGDKQKKVTGLANRVAKRFEGFTITCQEDYEKARTYLEEVLCISREFGDRRVEALVIGREADLGTWWDRGLHIASFSL